MDIIMHLFFWPETWFQSHAILDSGIPQS